MHEPPEPAETTETASRLLYPIEVCAELAVTPSTLKRYIAAGLLEEAVRTIGGHRRFARPAVEAAKALRSGHGRGAAAHSRSAQGPDTDDAASRPATTNHLPPST